MSRKRNKMNIEILINRLMEVLDVKTYASLAKKLHTTQGTVSGWKSRNAHGQIFSKIIECGYEELLPQIFDNNKNNSLVKNELNDKFNNSIGAHACETTNIKELAKLNKLFEIANSEKITINLANLNLLITKIEQSLLVKIIFKKIEEIYREAGLAGSSLQDHPTYEVAADSDGIKYGKKVLIDYILKTVKNADDEYFKNADTFPLIFKVDDMMMSIASDYVYYAGDENDIGTEYENKFNPVHVNIAAGKIIQSIKDSFSFNDNDTVWFLKNNITSIINIWEKWLECEKEKFTNYNNGQVDEEFKDSRESDSFYDPLASN